MLAGDSRILDGDVALRLSTNTETILLHHNLGNGLVVLDDYYLYGHLFRLIKTSG
jgi:hypothetical protein